MSCPASFHLQPDSPQGVCFTCHRWMGGGGSGAHSENVHERVVEEFSWPGGSATTLFLRTEANTAMVFASNIAPVTSAPVQTQVQQSLFKADSHK